MRKSSLVLLAIGLALSGCSSHKESKTAALDPFAGTGSPYYRGGKNIPVGGGKYHVGKPYQVAGRWFTPKEQPNYDKVGMSSWYGEAFNRRRTSNGEYFDMNQLTAAHATLPLPSYVRVTNLTNDRSVVVRVNDRGPFVGTRIIDVSKRAAEILDYKRKGTERVRVQYIGPAPINDPGGRDLVAMNQGGAATVPNRMLASAEQEAPPPVRRRKATQPVMAASYAPDDAMEQEQVQPDNGLTQYYFVELGTFADPDNVDRIRDGLQGVGRMQVTEIDRSSGPVFRLRIGPIGDAQEANTVYNEAVGFGIDDARIVEVPLQQASLR